MRLLLAVNNQATRRNEIVKSYYTFNWVQAAIDMHPACPNKKPNHLQNSFLRRTQFWVRKTFSKPASLKRASLAALIKKDGGEMLIAIVLDRPLAEAKALVEAPNAFIQAITRIMQDKRNHPVIAQMITPEAEEDPTPSERAASSSGGHSHRGAVTRHTALPSTQFQ